MRGSRFTEAQIIGVFPDEAQPHWESELHTPVSQACGMYV